MRSVSVRLADLNKVTIPIGFVGENLHTQVRIDCVKLFEDYPNAVPELTVNPPMGDTYPAVVTRDGDYVIWDIEDSDLIINGNGEIQLSFFVDEVIAKSYIARIRIEKSLVSTGDVPTPIENWIDEANEKLAEVEQWNNVTAEASTLAPGTSATVEITEENGHNKFEFGIPRGDKGDTGTPGFSPVIVVTDITGGHRVSITDVGGTRTVDIMDGEKGDTGNGIESAVLNQDYTLTLNFTDGTHYTTPSIRGAKGETGNGIASVTLNQDYTLTITYTNGQSTTTPSIRGEKGATGATPVISIGTVSTLSPGSDATASMDVTDPEHPVLSFGIPEGEPGNATIDDTSTANNRVWSAQKTNDLKSALTTDFEKCNTEINTVADELYSFSDIASSAVKGKTTGAITSIETGSAITFNTATNILHYYLEVTAGEVYKIQIRKAANKNYNIVFTDSNDIVKSLYGQGNGTMHVEVDTVAVPTGVTRMYISAQESSGPADWNANDRVRKATLIVAKNSDITATNKNVSILDGVDDLLISNNTEIPHYLVGAEDIEIGGIVSGENNDSTQNRARSGHLIPVFNGDIILSKPATNTSYTFYVIYYNTQKTWTGDSSVILLDRIQPVAITSDGYVRILFNPNNSAQTEANMKSIFGGLVSVYRARGSATVRAIDENRLSANQFEKVIDASNIVLGRLNFNDGTVSGTREYGFTPFFIPVNAGDALYRKYSSVGFGAVYYDANYSFISSTGNTYKGAAFMRIGFQLAGSTTPTVSNFSGIISIVRLENRTEMVSPGLLNRVEHSKLEDCVRGYVNPNSGNVSTHNYYMAITKFYRVKPGDIVRCANEDLNIWVMEYDLSLTPVRHSEYMRRLSKNPYPAGEWHVRTDGYVRAHFTNFQAQTEVDISTYYNSLEIVRSLSALNEYDAYAQKLVAPSNYVKPRKIREGEDLYTQSCVIIDGYLYCATDDYNGNTAIQKINIQTGAVIKTYTQDFGHASLDYCESTDTLLIGKGTTIALYQDFTTALEGDSLSIDNCIQIDCGSLLSYASICFGEDEYTVYAFVGNDGSAVRHDLCYKIQLGFGDNDLSSGGYGTLITSESYNGTAKLLKTFSGIVREFHDGQFGGRSLSYVQDIKYDGYLYVGFGTYGYNCFIVDLDELSNTYKIVGNYKIKYRNSSYTDLYGEPEGIAINGSKIITTLRDTVSGISCMFEFNRS